MRVGVIGAGHMGRIHARKYRTLGVDWLGIVDLDRERAEKLAHELGAVSCEDATALLHHADVVSVCVPPGAHLSVASGAIAAGCHVLVEKPIATSLADARSLKSAAEYHGRLLQVAHQERYNPAIRAAESRISQPRFLEIHRLGMPDPRDGQIDVVLDVMIHDLDLLLHWVGTDIEQIDAVGAPVLNDCVDIANARIRFASGCVANLTVSRVTPGRTRKIRIFDPSGYLSIDCEAQKVFRIYRENGGIRGETIAVEPGDCMEAQLRDFMDAVVTQRDPRVSADDAINALTVATRIQEAINAHLDAHGRGLLQG